MNQCQAFSLALFSRKIKYDNYTQPLLNFWVQEIIVMTNNNGAIL